MSNPFEKFLESQDPVLRKFVFSEILSKPASLRSPRAPQSQAQSQAVQANSNSLPSSDLNAKKQES